MWRSIPMLAFLIACGGASPAPTPAPQPQTEAQPRAGQPEPEEQPGDSVYVDALECLEDCQDRVGLDADRYCHESCGLEGGENTPCVDACLAEDASDPRRCVSHCSAEEHGIPICFADCVDAGGDGDTCRAQCGLD